MRRGGSPFGTGTTFVYTENAAKTAGVLALTDSPTHASASIDFVGDYSKASVIPTNATPRQKAPPALFTKSANQEKIGRQVARRGQSP